MKIEWIENGDLPASPTTMEGANGSTINTFGLTKREIFAMAAMQGLVSNPNIIDNKNGQEWISDEAVKYADALLTQLSKQQ